MIVTCDTNFYRKLVENVNVRDTRTLDKLIKAVITAEHSKGISAMMGTVSACEILSHLLYDVASRDFKSCLKASRVLYKHCQDGSNSYRLLPSPQTQIAKEYFGFDNQVGLETQLAVGQIFSALAKSTTLKTINQFAENLSKVKQHIDETENVLIQGIIDYCKSIDPNYTEWNLFVGDKDNRKKSLTEIRSIAFDNTTALAMLLAVHQQIVAQGYDKVPSKEEMTSMIQTYVKSYKTSLELRRFFWEQLINPGFDLTKKSRANYLWDEQILHFVNHQVGNENVLLITTDDKMVEAAKKCGCRDKVMKYDEYIDFLGIRQQIESTKKICTFKKMYFKVLGWLHL